MESNAHTGAMVEAGTGSNTIGWAVKQMWIGKAVSRKGWNGPEQYLMIQKPDTNSKMTRPYVYIRTQQADLVPWLCSQTDLLATDWYVVESQLS